MTTKNEAFTIPCEEDAEHVTVSVETAVTAISGWKSYAETEASSNHFTKAFFIDKEDILRLACMMDKHLIIGNPNSPKPNGARAYIGVVYNPETRKNEAKLYIVPAQKIYPPDGDPKKDYYDDILFKNEDGTYKENQVYDFTKPCPDSCDSGSSPLFRATLPQKPNP